MFKWVINAMLMCVFSFIAVFIVSSFVEYENMKIELAKIKMGIFIAGEDATIGTRKDESEANADDSMFDVSNYNNFVHYLAYLESVETQIESAGLNNSKAKEIIHFLRKIAEDYRNGNAEKQFEPSQFSLSYLNEDIVSSNFDDTLRKNISFNFNEQEVGIRVRIADTKVKLNGPTLINLGSNTQVGEGNFKDYAKIFGTADMAAIKMADGVESDEMWNYVIAYDLEFTVEWEHHFTTMFFYRMSFLKNTTALNSFFNENNFLKIKMPPIKYSRRYILIA